jgi:surfeit locus 1 family protein
VSRRTLFFAIFALAVSLACLRLGFWQVSRLRERQDRNARTMGRLNAPVTTLEALARDTAARFRRVSFTGRYDFEREMVLTARSRMGSPGVHILTPLRVDSAGPAVLVNRGWVYSPDGMRVDLARWRESEEARVEGFVEEFTGMPGPVSTPSFDRAVRRLNRDSLEARLPYALAPLVVVQQADSGVAAAAARGTPVRADPPPLSEGSHRAYAVQWFGFALVGVLGTVLVVARDRRRAPADGAPIARMG